MSKQTETQSTKSGMQTAQRIVAIFFGVVEIILTFRLFFKLLGANPGNGFVKGIYVVTQFFVGIFEGIFSTATAGGAGTKAVFEPATLIAMVVIAIIAWVVFKLMTPRTGTHIESTEQIERADQGQ